MPSEDDPSPVSALRAARRRSDGSVRPRAAGADGGRSREPARRSERRSVDATIQRLVEQYGRRRAVALRNQIVERCRPVVEAMARTMALRVPRCVDAQDLLHSGMWGLMQAIDSYRPARCDQFMAFMRIRVRGAMLDELRGMDYLTRQQRRRLRQREQAMAELRQELAREPSDAELAAAMGVSHSALRQSYRDGVRARQLTGDAEAGEHLDLLDRLADEAGESPSEAIERKELLAKIRAILRPVEWKVLQLHYLEGMSGKEVARRLRLSASRICQIHVRVVDRLKERLAAAVG